MLINVRSVNNKTYLIDSLILDETADLVCITKAWLGERDNINLSLFCLTVFRMWHHRGEEGQRGGVVLPVKPVRHRLGMECLHLVLIDHDRVGLLLEY